MFQDIEPHVFHNEYCIRQPEADDLLISVRKRDILVSRKGLEALKDDDAAKASCSTGAAIQLLPTVGQVRAQSPSAVQDAYYLLSIDRTQYFAAPEPLPETPELCYTSVMTLREMKLGSLGFGGAVAWQLADWYRLHRYCGCCAARTVHSEKERAVVCPVCGRVYYPRINPVVIIAIVDGDRILLTRYNRSGSRRHALVAGFVEIGETLEDAVRREIMEEVGLHVKNIRYCESQPWPFSSSLISGFFADVDGDPTIHLNTDGQEELAEGIWVTRDELVLEEVGMSLTWDMIRKFKENTF